MRLKILLRPDRPDCALSYNYVYALSSAIYRILIQAEPQYAAFLHDEGYPTSNNKRIKLFSFSRLFSERTPVTNHVGMRWFGKPLFWFFLSSPMEETFVHHFLVGLFRRNKLTLNTRGGSVIFSVMDVEPQTPPSFLDNADCLCLSPMTVSVDSPGHVHAQYAPPTDPAFADHVAMNLLRKHELLHGPFDHPLPITFRPSTEYIERKGMKSISVLLHIREGHDNETQVRGYVFPFHLTLHPDLIRTAWDCGLGEKNSMGFGFWAPRLSMTSDNTSVTTLGSSHETSLS